MSENEAVQLNEEGLRVELKNVRDVFDQTKTTLRIREERIKALEIALAEETRKRLRAETRFETMSEVCEQLTDKVIGKI